jgi:hypothetical protein
MNFAQLKRVPAVAAALARYRRAGGRERYEKPKYSPALVRQWLNARKSLRGT